MELVHWFVDFFLHLDQHLAEVIQQYGGYTYALLFLIVFLETGLVVTPLLPGDSLLFAAGSFAGLGALRLWPLFFLLCAAAILGDTVNYAIGAYLGPRVFHFPKSRFFNPEHLKKTHDFYEKYGGKTIIIARFVPIIRTGCRVPEAPPRGPEAGVGLAAEGRGRRNSSRDELLQGLLEVTNLRPRTKAVIPQPATGCGPSPSRPARSAP